MRAYLLSDTEEFTGPIVNKETIKYESRMNLDICARGQKALGLGQLILGHPEILRVMNWCGAAFLLWFAWKIANAGRAGEAGTTHPVGFFGAAFFQWVNPKGWLVAVGAAGTYLQPDAGSQLLQALAFACLFFAVALPSGFVWLVLGASMQGLLRDERSARIFNIVMALALAASVVMIFW
jgi:threonine/homoserine/homoserine lactone efflux protein